VTPPATARAHRVVGVSRRGLAVLGALVALAAVSVVRPERAGAGQSSQATPAFAAQLTTGVYHTCAVLDDPGLPAARGGHVRCWGFSGDGQVGYANRNTIGDDETPGSVGPVDVGAGRTVTALAAGDSHSCAVLDDRSVRCWGFAFDGELGYGNQSVVGIDETPGSHAPVDLGIGRSATAITAGSRHTCAILDDGSVRCWGLGTSGQLGYGNLNSIGDDESPGSVGPVSFGAVAHTARAITAGGDHTCAILDDGTVRCWGAGGAGQLGYGDTAAVLDPGAPGAPGPVDLGAGRTAAAISAGDAHTCAILDDGSVRCWGLGDSGQLGYGNRNSIGDNPAETPATAGPVDLGAGRTAIAISAGGNHTCAVLDDGSVRCWGSGVSGELGYGNLDSIGDDETPGSVGAVDIGTGRTARAISSGALHTCARLDDGSVRCWGDGGVGRLGHCDQATIGDDETPGSVDRVDLGLGGAACPAVTPLVTPPGVTPTPTPPPSPDSGDSAALRREMVRAEGLRGCRASVLRRQRSERRQALRRHPRPSRLRALTLRRAANRAAHRRARCLARFGRTPGRVTTLAATAGAAHTIVLTFSAPASDGSAAPAARSYVIKQSLRPIRTALEFRRAHTLCRGLCTFAVTQLRTAIRLNVTQLLRRTTYYYEIAARDNVSRRIGPRSRTVSATTK
jgi:alpha-tubulin suppressor-like RCC1 family protein